MFNKRSPYFIGLITFCLIGIGFTFQNCAEPLDPALLTENLPSEANGSNNGTDTSNITIDKPTYTYNANPITEDKVANITANVNTNYDGKLVHEFYKNGIKVSGQKSALIGKLAVGDSIVYTVTAGTVVRSDNVPLIINADNSNDNNNDDNNNVNTNSGKVALRAVPGTKAFKSYYINSGEILNFAVEIDKANSDQAAHSSPITWETKDIRNTTWKYHSSRRDLKVTADHTKITLYYRAKTTYRGVTKYSSQIKVVAQSYTSSGACIAPYVASGINSYTRYKVSTSCSDDGKNCRDTYAHRLKSIKCSVLQKASDPLTHYNVYTNPVPGNAHKGGWTACGSGNVDLKTNFVSDFKVANMRHKNYAYACTRPSIGSSKIYTTKELSGGSATKALTCPNYSYITDFHRYSSYGNGLIERIKCGIIR